MKKNQPIISLRLLITILVGMLVLVALTFSIGSLWDSRVAYLNMQTFAKRAQLAEICLQAERKIALESQLSLQILHHHAPVSTENRDKLIELRAKSDSAWHDLLQKLPEDLQPATINFPSLWLELNAQRSTIDQQIALPLMRRDTSLAERWLAANNALIIQTQTLLLDIFSFSRNNELTSISAGVERFNTLQTLAINFRNIINLELYSLAEELRTNKTVRTKTLIYLQNLRSRSDQIWLLLKDIDLNFSAEEEHIKMHIENVQSALFNHLYPLQDQIIAASKQNQSFATPNKTYEQALALSTNAVSDLATGIGLATSFYINEQLQKANRLVVFSLASMLLTLILGGVVVFVLIHRFARPLREISLKISEIAQSQTDSAGHFSDVGDEFFQVQQALEQLEKNIDSRLRSEERLARNEQINASILACAPLAIITTDTNGLITLFSPGAEAMLGYSALEVIGYHTPLVFHDSAEIAARADLLSNLFGITVAPDFSIFSQRKFIQIAPKAPEWTFICKDGKRLTVLLSVSRLRDARDHVIGFIAIANDVTEQKKISSDLLNSMQEIDRQNNLFNALLKTVPIGIYMAESIDKPLISNDAAQQMLGIYNNDTSLAYPKYKWPERTLYPPDALPLANGLRGVTSYIDDLLIVRPDGRERILEVAGSPVTDASGKVWASVVSLVDITERSHARAEIAHYAYHDHLTQLPNRRLLHDRIEMTLTQARREQLRFAIMLIDLDKFKPVNDEYGHAIGDLLLQAVARRMQSCLRESDTLARIGGDEFAVVLPSIIVAQDALSVAEKIRASLNQPFSLEGGYVANIACCIGVAIYPDHGVNEAQLLNNADEAMYTAKQLGRNCVHIFSELPAISNGLDNNMSVVYRVWLASYECGDAELDQAHRELFRLANELIYTFVSGEERPEQLLHTLDELIEAVSKHFNYEELVLKKHQFSELAEHLKKHQQLLARAHELRAKAQSWELSLGDLVNFVAQDMVLEHIIREDRKFFSFIKTNLQDSTLAQQNNNKP